MDKKTSLTPIVIVVGIASAIIALVVSIFLILTNPNQFPTRVKSESVQARVVDRVRQDLATTIGVKAEDISVVKTESKQWPDTSLGCSKPGLMYAQVITPGYSVILVAQGKTFVYHTDLERNITLCSNTPLPTQ